jgi:hypothetical protein
MAVRDDFTAGEVLAAADLNDTFASKPPFAYGTATPSTTVEGFIWYDENDTPPTAKFWDGSAFEPISAPSGLVHIATESLSAVSSVSLNGVFTSAYENYVIVMKLLATGANTALSMRLRAAGSDNTTANSYIEQLLQVTNTTVAGGRTTSNIWQIGSISSTTVSALNLQIFAPQLAEPTAFMAHQMNPGSSAILEQHYGTHNQSTAYDGFTVSLSNAITGSLRVYGYQNS